MHWLDSRRSSCRQSSCLWSHAASCDADARAVFGELVVPRASAAPPRRLAPLPSLRTAAPPRAHRRAALLSPRGQRARAFELCSQALTRLPSKSALTRARCSSCRASTRCTPRTKSRAAAAAACPHRRLLSKFKWAAYPGRVHCCVDQPLTESGGGRPLFASVLEIV